MSNIKVAEMDDIKRSATIDIFIKYGLMDTLDRKLHEAKKLGIRHIFVAGYEWDVHFAEILLTELKKENLHVAANNYPG